MTAHGYQPARNLSGLGRSLPFSVPVNLQMPFDPQLRKKGRLLIPLSSGKSPGRGDWQRGLIFGWLSDLWHGIWVGGYRSVAVRLMSYSSVCEDDFSRDWVQEGAGLGRWKERYLTTAGSWRSWMLCGHQGQRMGPSG